MRTLIMSLCEAWSRPTRDAARDRRNAAGAPRRKSWLRAIAAAATLAACGGGGGGTAAPDATDCTSDPRAETFVAGMMKTGAATGMEFTLVSSDPAPPARPNNDWVIALADSTGAPLDGATVSVKPFMPDHNHGTGIVPTITPVAGTPGSYDANPINTFMPGIWEITITARPAGGGAADTDSAKFTFCINN